MTDPDFLTLVADNLEGATKHDCCDDWLIENRHEIVRRLITMQAALSEYHTTFCEGWCEELPTGAAFEDCSGCAARVALLNKPLS